jgi:hypothetical protein
MQVTATKKKLQASDSHWFLFILFPFFSVLTALKSFRASWAKNVVWAFVVFYGFTFAIGKESTDSDINRYVDELREMYKKDFTLDEFVRFFSESGEADVGRTLIAVIVSRFSQSQQVLTAVYGFIFGFFFTRNLWYIFDRLKGKMKWVTIIMLLVFFLVNPFWNINGFRFNTAVHIFIYGLLPYLIENKKKSLVFCFLSVLMHFSFLLPIAVLLIYLAAGNRLTAYFIFFIISTFISNINITELNKSLEENLPEVFLERSQKYRDEDRVNEFREVREDDTGVAASRVDDAVDQNWYVIYYNRALYASVSLILIAMYAFGRRKLLGSGWLLNMYCFSLLIFGVANIMYSLPSGERFLMIAILTSVALIIFYLQNQVYETYINNTVLIVTPFLLLYAIVALRTGLYSISLTTILGNPILAIFTNYNLSLNDLIK